MTPYDVIDKRICDAATLDELTAVLFTLLNGDFAVWEDGALYSIRHLVTKFDGLKIEIYSREHSPPHFHVKGGQIDATFSISDCELIEGNLDGRRINLIKWWHEKCKEKLILIWNQTRPNGCPVGEITV